MNLNKTENLMFLLIYSGVTICDSYACKLKTKTFIVAEFYKLMHLIKK